MGETPPPLGFSVEGEAREVIAMEVPGPQGVRLGASAGGSGRGGPGGETENVLKPCGIAVESKWIPENLSRASKGHAG
jgi:hypothetical protein